MSLANISQLFVLVSEMKNGRIIQGLRNNLKSDGKTATVERARHADRGQAVIVRKHRELWRQGLTVLGRVLDGQRRGRRCRQDQHVDVFERQVADGFSVRFDLRDTLAEVCEWR